MARSKKKHRGEIEAFLKTLDKKSCRKRGDLFTRGDLIPPNKAHKLKNKYNRQKEKDWRNFIDE